MKVKKIVAYFLSVLMLLSALPVFAMAQTGETDACAQPRVPTIPEGYVYEGDWFTDADGRQYFYISEEASSFGIAEGYWIDENGQPMQTEDAEANAEEEPLCMAMAEEALPAAYDSREDGCVTAVEYQLGGTCWAHASIAALESNALRQGLVSDSSKVNMSEYHTLWNSYNGYVAGYDDSRNDGYLLSDGEEILHGGTAIKACRALWNFAGAVAEARLQLDESSKTAIKSSMDSTLGFHNKYLRDITLGHIYNIDYEDASAVKSAILEYGGLYLAYDCNQNYNKLVYDGGTPYGVYYNAGGQADGGHAVEVIGWDDSFPKERFTSCGATPENDGAWLIKNSWGSGWSKGVDGFFWMSYEEPGIYQICALEAVDTDDFECVYMHDGLGAMLDFSGVPSNGGVALTTNKAANVFVADKDIQLTSFMLEGITKGDYTLEIYRLKDNYGSPVDGEKIYTQNGSVTGENYVDITGTATLKEGEHFSVVVSGLGKCYAEGSSTSLRCYTSHAGESYYYSAGSWKDASEKGYNNICLRAVGKEITQENSITWNYDPTQQVLSFTGTGRVTDGVDNGAWKQYASTAKAIALGKEITGVGSGVFGSFTQVTTFAVDAENSKLSVEDGVLMNQNKTVLIAYPAGKEDTYYTVPRQVTELAGGAFCGNQQLRYLDMTACGVAALTSGTVKSCTALKNVNLPANLKELVSGAFSDNGHLAAILIPDSVTTFSKSWIKQSGGYPETYTGSSRVIAMLSAAGVTAHTGHSHAYTSDGVICDGQEHLVFCTCGRVEKQILPLGHDYHWVIDKDSTCSVAGTQHQECAICGHTQSMNTTVETKSHSWVEVKERGADCQHGGKTYEKCSVCGATGASHDNDLYGNHQCGKGGQCSVNGCDYQCSCSCHKTGISGAFWKVSLFFYRIFGTHGTCACGARHY